MSWKRPDSQTLKAYLLLTTIVLVILGAFGAMFYYLGVLNNSIKATTDQMIDRAKEQGDWERGEAKRQQGAADPFRTPEKPPALKPEGNGGDKPPANRPKDRLMMIDLAMPPRLPPAVARVASHIRPIRVGYRNGYAVFGTAALISDGTVLTCNHLFSHNDESGTKAKKIDTICDTKLPLVQARHVFRSSVSDIAFVGLDCPTETLTFRRTGPHHRERAWMVGIDYDFRKMSGRLYARPISINLHTSLRRLSWKHYPKEVAIEIDRSLDLMAKRGLKQPVALDAPVRPGNSGSLVVDRRGMIIGMVFAGKDLPQGFFIPTYNLIRFSRMVGVRLTLSQGGK